MKGLGMSNLVLDESRIKREESKLFFSQWIKHPARLGTVAPISEKLANLAASFIEPHERVLEIGAGTGRLTRSLLKRNINIDNFYALELDPNLCSFLKKSLPFVNVIEGNAFYLDKIIPSQLVGELDVVVSAIPLMYLKPVDRIALIQACFKVLKPKGKILHVTYNPNSPLDIDMSSANLKIESKRVGAVWLNLPPGFIWQYVQN